MRIKEEIKRSGFFWLPSFPENQIFGTLFISDGGTIRLELSEPLDPSIQAQLGPIYPDSLNPILGHVEKDGPVRIAQCYRVSSERNFTHGRLIVSPVIQAGRVFMGLPHEEDASLRYNTISFSVEGIDEWVGISGIEVNTQSEKSATTILYNQPEDISFNLKDDIQLKITFGWKPPGFPWSKKAEVSQKTFFKLISKDPCELDEFISIAQKIAAFLCFVMNEIVCLDSMRATSDNLRQDIGNSQTAPIPVKIYCPSWPYAKDEPKINALDILFRFTEIQSRTESIINTWIDNYEQIAPAFDLYFLTRAGTLPTLNLQFLTLVQALEAFHRKISNEMHMDEDEFAEIRENIVNLISKKDRNWFCSKLDYANELTLKNRIERLIEPFDCLIDDERKPQLIKSIRDTRHYLTHHDKKLEQKAAKGRDLEVLCHKMNALFRLQFLKLIGFDEQEINDIVDKCTYLKGACNL